VDDLRAHGCVGFKARKQVGALRKLSEELICRPWSEGVNSACEKPKAILGVVIEPHARASAKAKVASAAAMDKGKRKRRAIHAARKA
jgi:hypothetical protein